MIKFFAYIFIFPVIFILVLVPLLALDAWATRDLWNWFVHPILGVPAIDIYQAAGLSVAIGMFTMQTGIKKEKSAIISAIAKPVVYWLIGWVIFNWVMV